MNDRFAAQSSSISVSASEETTTHTPLSHIPSSICSLSDYQHFAKSTMNGTIYSHIAGGAANEISLALNRESFDQCLIYNRVFRDFSEAHTQQHFFKDSTLAFDLPHPILLAPVAYQKLVHPEGELATALAADATDTTMICSTLSSYTLEDIAKTAAHSKWFQLYFQNEKTHSLQLVKRAEAAGYKTIVITADASIQGLHNRAQRAGFKLPSDVQAANLLGQPPSEPITLSASQSDIFHGVMANAPSWQDIVWLRSQTDLPIFIKGISHPEDASKGLSCGVNGFIISNHGGRSLDTLPPPLLSLPAIRQTVGNAVPILIDGGIQRGSDVFKAIAMGANAVLIGRPQLYALHTAGALGVAHMLKLLRQEFEQTMALAGCRSIDEITEHCVFRR